MFNMPKWWYATLFAVLVIGVLILVSYFMESPSSAASTASSETPKSSTTASKPSSTSAASNSSSSTSAASKSSSGTSSASDNSPKPEASLETARQFIEDYNTSPYATEKLTAGEEFNPTDENDERHRKELTRSLYDGAKGLACNAGDVKVDIVELPPTTLESDTPRTTVTLQVYASGPEESVLGFYRAAAHVLGPKLTDEQIEEAVQEQLRSGYGTYIARSTVWTTLSPGEAMLRQRFQVG